MSNTNVLSKISTFTTDLSTKSKDSFLIANLKTGQTLPNGLELHQPLTDNSILLIISQGIGVSDLASAASELTVLAIKDALLRIPPNIPPYDRLVAAVEEANNIIWNERQVNSLMKDVFTSVTVVLIEEDQVFVAEVGNSRAYLIRSEQIKQLTTDQIISSLPPNENSSQISAENLISADQKKSYKSPMLQAIGKTEAIKVAISMFQLRNNDILFLCNNNLSKILSPDKILEMSLTTPVDKISAQMVSSLSNDSLSENISFIVAQFTGEALSNKKPGTTITSSVQILSRFDPQEKVKKSHIRTLALGEASLTKKYYKNSKPSSLANLTELKSIWAFPESYVIKQECHALLEHLEYCHTLLSIKPEQLRYASTWLEQQGYRYSNLYKQLENTQIGVKHLQEIKRLIFNILKDLEDNENSSS